MLIFLKTSQSDVIFLSWECAQKTAGSNRAVWPQWAFSVHKDEENLLQLQFHHTRTAFWTWSKHSMHCHCRGPGGTAHTWGKEHRSHLKLTLEIISINFSQGISCPAWCKKIKKGFSLTSCLSLPLPAAPQTVPLYPWVLQEAATTDLGVS